MTTDLLKPSNEPEHWHQGALYVAAEIKTIDLMAARKKAATPAQESEANSERQKAIAPAIAVFNVISASNWPHNRLIYTLGQVPVDHLVLLCETRRVDWNYAFRAKAAFGTAEDIEQINEAAKIQGQSLDLAGPLTWAAKPQVLVAGLRHNGNLSTTEWLLDNGASPNQEALYREVVEGGRPDIGRAFARHAISGNLDLAAWMNWAKGNGRSKLFKELRAIWWDYARYTPADSQTLLEVKPLGDQHAGQVRYIFNFAAQRVTEIYEVGAPQHRHTEIKDFEFEDYNDDALRIARDKLRELGGDPADHVSSPGGRKGVTRAHVKGLG